MSKEKEQPIEEFCNQQLEEICKNPDKKQKFVKEMAEKLFIDDLSDDDIVIESNLTNNVFRNDVKDVGETRNIKDIAKKQNKINDVSNILHNEDFVDTNKLQYMDKFNVDYTVNKTKELQQQLHALNSISRTYFILNNTTELDKIINMIKHVNNMMLRIIQQNNV